MTRNRVLVTRAAAQADELLAAMRDAGLSPVSVPTISVEIDPERGRLAGAARSLPTYRWVVVTSANGARAILEMAERTGTRLGAPSWAAIGPATRRALDWAGIEVTFLPRRAGDTAMAVELPLVRGDRVLVVRGDLADGDLAGTLRARGADVDDVVAYRTLEGPEASRGLLRTAVAEGSIAAVVFTSGSTVRGLLSLAAAESIDVRSFPAVCIGPATADQARAAGFRILAIAPIPTPSALATATVEAVARQLQETP